MPNWCDNYVTVTVADPEYVDELITFVSRLRKGVERGRLHLLDTFVPMPEKYEHTVSGIPSTPADDGLTWYEWQHARWGVKWGDCNGEIKEVSDDRVSLWFVTPWGPPDLGLQAISRQFPHLIFAVRWDEESPSNGEFTVQAGGDFVQRSAGNGFSGA